MQHGFKQNATKLSSCMRDRLLQLCLDAINCINPLMPNDLYSGCTAPLTSKRCILYIYSTNIGTEYFKHGIYSQFFSLQNAVCFIILTYLVPVLFKFYIQDVLKLKKIIPAPKGYTTAINTVFSLVSKKMRPQSHASLKRRRFYLRVVTSSAQNPPQTC